MVRSSELGRKKLEESNVFKLFMDNLTDEVNFGKTLDALGFWHGYNSEMVEKVILDAKFVGNLVQILKGASRTSFQLMITFYKKLIQLSDSITKKFCGDSDFLRELVDRLDQGALLMSDKGSRKIDSGSCRENKEMRKECANPSALVQKEILEILYYMLSQSVDYKRILSDYNLYPMLINILQNAQNDEMVILEEIATRLLKLHAN